MNFRYILPIYFFVFSILLAESDANKILIQISNLFNNINRSMIIESSVIKNGEIKKSQKVKIQIYWPHNSKKKRLTLIEFFKPKRKSGVKLWEHTFTGNSTPLIWMTMPVTGKLKDISNKKPKRNDFDISELQLTEEVIFTYQNSIIKNSDELIIESISNIDQQKKLIYIDKKFKFIYKVETYNKKNKILRSIECVEFKLVDNYKIASKVTVNDLKKKHTVDIKITDFSFTEFADTTIFEPKGK